MRSTFSIRYAYRHGQRYLPKNSTSLGLDTERLSKIEVVLSLRNKKTPWNDGQQQTAASRSEASEHRRPQPSTKVAARSNAGN